MTTETQSATIILFPARSRPPEDRLAKALDSLNQAMAEQKAAVAAWRDVLGELKISAAKLDASLRTYRSNLTSLGTSVSALHGMAKALEARADGVLAQ